MNNFFRMIGLEHPITKIIAIILIFSFIFLLLGSIPVFKDLIPFLVTGGIGYWAYRHFFKHADDQVKEKRKKHLMIVMSAGAIFGAAMASLTQNPTIEETIGAAIFFAFITPFVWPVLHTLYHTFFVAKSRADQRLRGAQLVVEKIVLKMLDKVLFSSQIGNIPLPRDVETRGVLLAGAPGTGKSVAMIQMLQKFRERGDRAVIFDVSSQFLERFYRKGDIVFNPLDSRSPAWSPFAEIQDPRLDCDRFAKSLIPDGEGNGAEWNFFAQQTISAILKKLVLAGATTNHSFLSALAHSDLKDLAEMVKGTPAARLISEDAKGMTASILGVLGAYAAPFGILDPAAGEASFSLRKWMTQGEAGSWLFLTVKDDQSALLNPLISCWLDVLISSLLSLPPDQNRRVVFGLDEFATLPKIQSVHDLLSKGRKYGSVPLLGL
ncbi:MAG: type IV secretion system DNA-binding domain-containing protein, partial [Pseudomonadota bacterium]|nr:type IV secretion system DNA-binding domain-containing protein [Pseudomonadota bacterium]